MGFRQFLHVDVRVHIADGLLGLDDPMEVLGLHRISDSAADLREGVVVSSGAIAVLAAQRGLCFRSK